MIEKESDNLISMKKTMTATEVARNFSEVLDAVVNGDEITITRGSKPVAVLASARELIPNSLRLAAALDEHFEKYRDAPLDLSYDPVEYVRQLRDEASKLDEKRWARIEEILDTPHTKERD